MFGQKITFRLTCTNCNTLADRHIGSVCICPKCSNVWDGISFDRERYLYNAHRDSGNIGMREI